MIRDKDIVIEKQYLKEQLMSTEAELERLKKQVPDDARLRAAKHGEVYQYFLRERGSNKNGKYIHRRNESMAVVLAQIEYDEELIKVLKEALESLEKCSVTGVEDPFQAALERISPGKRLLVNLPHIPDEIFLKEWKAQIFEGLKFGENVPQFYTRNGLRVRSKSEVIIADILDEMSVPFLYEKPLLLSTGLVHPDFTLLNLNERKEIYWEHFGIMDDMDYRNMAFNKIRNYEANGIYQYSSFVFTFETGKHPLNTRDIRRMVVKLKERLGYE
ncbi:MAG: hypothetical protein J5825_02980 [Lachnospiraceae bacterium]|nr:hypothetical protein [Lachnospiraceae bacterium]